MNKYKVNSCFVFILLACLMCVTEAGSRKRYRNKKKQKPEKTVHTHMNVNSYKNQTPTTTTTTPTGMPQLRNQINSAQENSNNNLVEYNNPLITPNKTQPVQQEEVTPKLAEMPSVEEDEEPNIELNFENAELQNFQSQIEDIFEITLISDDVLQPLPQGKKGIKNNKISFKTHQPLSKKETWNLFVTFLDIAGFTLVPQPDPKVFRIVTMETARKSPLPTFIGVDPSTLPDTDELIRYVYFLENASTETIMGVIGPLRSSSSQGLIELKEHKGFILTDKAYNIKMLMSIVKELDKVSIPETMSILKLRNADAKQVQDLYKELLPKEEATSRFFTKKQPTSLYFPENTRIIADPRTNTLILLGPKNAIDKIENFIIKYIDVELDQAYSPLYTYQLKYADASTICEILSKVTSFGNETEAGKYGGVRGVDQYMQPMVFIPEKETNRIVIKGHYEDYMKVKKIIEKLDEKQPQVAIEVLIVSVDVTNTKSLGAQIRSKQPGPNGLLGNNIKFQTSGLYGDEGIVSNPNPSTGAQRLLGNLISLATGAVPGTSLLTLGQDAFGVWGIFQALQTVTDAEVVANPFILASNNAKATVAIGEERRIVTQEVVSGGTGAPQNAFDACDANLEVSITPQINSDGMIGLAINIIFNEFTDPTNQTDATQNTRNINTSAIVANKEVLALGGLIRDNIQSTESKVPILGDIPILGWFFKNKNKSKEQQSLLVLISTRIIDPHKATEMHEFTKDHVNDYRDTLDSMDSATNRRDPIHRLFFQDKIDRAKSSVEELIFERHKVGEEDFLNDNDRKNELASKKIALLDEKIPVLPIHKNVEQNVDKLAHNTLIQAIHNKKRSQLSLSEFLHDKEPRT